MKGENINGRFIPEKRKWFHRVCRRCGETFITTAKFGKVCDDCLKKRGIHFKDGKGKSSN